VVSRGNANDSNRERLGSKARTQILCAAAIRRAVEELCPLCFALRGVRSGAGVVHYILNCPMTHPCSRLGVGAAEAVTSLLR